MLVTVSATVGSTVYRTPSITAYSRRHLIKQVQAALMPAPCHRRDRARRDATGALEQSYAALLHRQDHGEDVTGPLAWQRNRIAELHRDLAA
jgi:hypothetical protein